MAALGAEVLELLNGDPFIQNEAGEEEQYRMDERVLVRHDFPGHDSAEFFAQDISDPETDDVASLGLTAAQATTFITDQLLHFRLNGSDTTRALALEQLMELCVLRYIMYKNRLTPGRLNLADHFVRYYDLQVLDATQAGNILNAINTHGQADGIRAEAVAWLNGNPGRVRTLTKSFSNIVCCVAFVFRQKGHHYLDSADYEQAYINLWSKIRRGDNALVAKWKDIATLGLHAIIPQVLDYYWIRMASKARVAAPLALRLNVPAAGTAAVFALSAGWTDARHIYGRLLQEHEQESQLLQNILHTLKERRWMHGINGRYYGASSARIDLSRFSALAATVVGVYESAAQDSTLLQSKSLIREAKGAPLQKDIAIVAAQTLKSAFVKTIVGQKKIEGAPTGLHTGAAK